MKAGEGIHADTPTLAPPYLTILRSFTAGTSCDRSQRVLLLAGLPEDISPLYLVYDGATRRFLATSCRGRPSC